jgi:hypothetical protein
LAVQEDLFDIFDALQHGTNRMLQAGMAEP